MCRILKINQRLFFHVTSRLRCTPYAPWVALPRFAGSYMAKPLGDKEKGSWILFRYIPKLDGDVPHFWCIISSYV